MVDNISNDVYHRSNVIKTVLGEEISMEELGGKVHAEITGNAHFFAKSELECFDQLKSLSHLFHGTTAIAKVFPPKEPKFKGKIEDIIPSDPNNPTMSGYCQSYCR